MERMARKKDKALQQVFEAQKRVRGDDKKSVEREIGWNKILAKLDRQWQDQEQAEAAPDQLVISGGVTLQTPFWDSEGQSSFAEAMRSIAKIGQAASGQPIVNSGAMMASVIEWLKTPDQDKIATAVANNADKVVALEALELAKMGINSTAELYKVMGVNQPSVPDEPVAIMESTVKGVSVFETAWKQRVESANARAAVAQREEMRIREQLQGANRPGELENSYRDQMDKEIAVVLNELSRQYQNGSITVVQFFDIANREREAINERYRREAEKRSQATFENESEDNYRYQIRQEMYATGEELRRQFAMGNITYEEYGEYYANERKKIANRYRREASMRAQSRTSVTRPFIEGNRYVSYGAMPRYPEDLQTFVAAINAMPAIKNLNPPENILYPPGTNSIQRYLDAMKGRIAAAIEATGAADKTEPKQPAIEENPGLPPGAGYAINEKQFWLMQEYARLQMARPGYFFSRVDLIQESSSSTPRQELSEWRQTDGFKTMPAILRDLLEKAVREWTTPSQQEFDSVERMVEIECV